jgi:factor associated with neutral sphingomyelinase activation
MRFFPLFCSSEKHHCMILIHFRVMLDIYTYSVDYGRVNDTLTAHDDAVQCLALSESTLASGSWDSTLKTWAIRPTGIDKLPLATFVDLETEVKAVEVDVQSNLVVGGSNDGMMFLGDLRMKSSIRTWHAHDDAVVAIRVTPDGRIISCAKDGHLKVENKSGHELLSVQLAESLMCMTSNGQRLLLGGDSGQLRVWDLLEGEEVAQLSKKSKSAVSCMAIPQNGQTIVTGSDDGSITKWSP